MRGLFKSVGYTPPTMYQQQHPIGTSASPLPHPSATLAYRKNVPAGFDQHVKMYDRMMALLAILSHISSIRPNPIDDGVQRILLDRHGHQLANIECGEGYDDLYS